MDPVHSTIDAMFEVLDPFRGRKPIRYRCAYNLIRKADSFWQGCARMIDSYSVPSVEAAKVTLQWLRGNVKNE